MKQISFRKTPVRALVFVVVVSLIGLVAGWALSKAQGVPVAPDHNQAAASRQLREPTCTINGYDHCPTVRKKHRRAARKFRNGHIRRDDGFRPRRMFRHPKKARRVIVRRITRLYRHADNARLVTERAVSNRVRARRTYRRLVADASCSHLGREPQYPAPYDTCEGRPLADLKLTEHQVEVGVAATICGSQVVVAVVTRSAKFIASFLAGSGCVWAFWSQVN